MKVCFVVEGVPQRGASGGSIVMRSYLEAAVERGSDVSLVSFVGRWDRELGFELLEQRIAELRALGIDVRTLPTPERFAQARSPLEEFFPHAALAPDVEHAIAELGPDVVVGFDTGVLLALRGVRTPVFAIPGDPRHLVWRYQLRATTWRERLSRAWLASALAYLRRRRELKRGLVELARSFPAVGMFGAQHAAWLTRAGVPTTYLPLAMADQAEAVRPAKEHDGMRVLVLGGLGTTATRLGLDLLVDEVLPELRRLDAAGSIELRVAGSGTLPTRLELPLREAGVVLRGFVESSAQEIADSDVFLMASPYPVGARTRVVEALSLGAPVVSHELGTAGIPELRDGENALLGGTGRELAGAVVRLAGDAELRRSLAKAARRTWEEHFAPPVASAVLLREVEQLARRAAS